MRLPEGYTAAYEDDLLVIRLANGNVLGRYTPAADPRDIELDCHRHAEEVARRISEVERQLGRRGHE